MTHRVAWWGQLVLALEALQPLVPHTRTCRNELLSIVKPLISKHWNFGLCMLHDERMKEGFSKGAMELPASTESRFGACADVPWCAHGFSSLMQA